MSHRLEQVASTLHRAVAANIGKGLGDPRIRGLISVTRVDVSPDMRHADVFVTIMPEQHEKLTMEGLKAAELHIQNAVKPQLPMRLMPHLHFKLDTKLKKEMAVLQSISEARARDEKDGVAKPNDKPEGMPEDPDAED
jgi:ribosome-binding factor A